MKLQAYSLIVLSTLMLASCQTWQGFEEDLGSMDMPSFSSSDSGSGKFLSSCPQVEIVPDLAVLNDFESLSKTTPDNLITSVVLSKTDSSCDEKSRSVVVDLKLAFAGTLGPKGRMHAGDMPFFTYPYFVAVTAPSGEIMAKEVFAASVTYNRGETAHTHHETLRHIIPLDDPFRGGRYKVMVGFQLNPEQLEYNREQLRLTAEADKARQKAEAQAAKAAADAAKAAEKAGKVPVSTAPVPQPNQPANIVVTPAPGPVDITAPVQ